MSDLTPDYSLSFHLVQTMSPMIFTEKYFSQSFFDTLPVSPKLRTKLFILINLLNKTYMKDNAIMNKFPTDDVETLSTYMAIFILIVRTHKDAIMQTIHKLLECILEKQDLSEGKKLIGSGIAKQFHSLIDLIEKSGEPPEKIVAKIETVNHNGKETKVLSVFYI